jgi:EAL domain-containing protein (putative c-di-GMP-specific phosphodiesterase class I)/GGDEF domain-containing protein
MSMYRQLWLAIILSTLLALVGSLLASTLSSRSYLNEQLRMKNSDNATVLALSLSQKNIDPVELELVIAALFDSGHYAAISVTDPSGKTIVERVAAAEKLNVPSWFINSFPILSAPGQAQISSGWKQLGTISLVTQSGFAYQALWKSTKEMIATLALSGLIAGYLGTLILRRLKQPLRVVIDQANAMRERRFIVTPEPKVPELRQLTTAMNSTVVLLQSMFAEETERLETLRKQTNTDPVTSLANRAHFMAQLLVMLETEEAPPGSLILLRMSHLAEINRQYGRGKADDLLKAIATLLMSLANLLPDGFAARLNGTDFALMFRQTDAEAVSESLLQSILTEFSMIEETPVSVFIGFGDFDYGLSAGVLLSQIDQAVASAEVAGASTVRKAVPLNIAHAPKSNEEWAKLILGALEQNLVKLALFPVVDFSGKIIHREAALRLMFGGEWFPAGRFLPVAERIAMTDKLDLAAVSLALADLSSDKNADDIAVNLSAQSIQSSGFRTQLKSILLSKPAVSRRLWLEIPEHGAFSNMDAFRAFYEDIRTTGCKLGLEHFGRQFGQNMIHDLTLDYVKVDASFIRGIEMNQGNQAYVKGISTIIHRIGLQIFAEGVHSSAELEALRSLGLDGITGPAIGAAFDFRSN